MNDDLNKKNETDEFDASFFKMNTLEIDEIRDKESPEKTAEIEYIKDSRKNFALGMGLFILVCLLIFVAIVTFVSLNRNSKPDNNTVVTPNTTSSSSFNDVSSEYAGNYVVYEDLVVYQSYDSEAITSVLNGYEGFFNEGTLQSGCLISVSEAMMREDILWGKIGDSAWVKLREGSTYYASKQDN